MTPRLNINDPITAAYLRQLSKTSPARPTVFNDIRAAKILSYSQNHNGILEGIADTGLRWFSLSNTQENLSGRTRHFVWRHEVGKWELLHSFSTPSIPSECPVCPCASDRAELDYVAFSGFQLADAYWINGKIVPYVGDGTWELDDISMVLSNHDDELWGIVTIYGEVHHLQHPFIPHGHNSFGKICVRPVRVFTTLTCPENITVNVYYPGALVAEAGCVPENIAGVLGPLSLSFWYENNTYDGCEAKFDATPYLEDLVPGTVAALPTISQAPNFISIGYSNTVLETRSFDQLFCVPDIFNSFIAEGRLTVSGYCNVSLVCDDVENMYVQSNYHFSAIAIVSLKRPDDVIWSRSITCNVPTTAILFPVEENMSYDVDILSTASNAATYTVSPVVIPPRVSTIIGTNVVTMTPDPVYRSPIDARNPSPSPTMSWQESWYDTVFDTTTLRNFKHRGNADLFAGLASVFDMNVNIL